MNQDMTDLCPKCVKPMTHFSSGDDRIDDILHCQACQMLVAGGEVIHLPSKNPVDIQETMAMVTRGAREDLYKNPEDRVDKYFARVFNYAFSEGFFRAYFYFRHTTRTGRLRRLQALWKKGRRAPERGVFLNLSAEEVTEFDKLMMLGVPRK